MTSNKSLIIIVLLCASLIPSSVFAEGTEHTHSICAGTSHDHNLDGEADGCVSVTYTPLSEALTKKEDADTYSGTLSTGNYYLDKNVTLYPPENALASIIISGNVNLCLNGYSLDGDSSTRIIRVQNDSTLNLCDCNSSKNNAGAITNGKSQYNGSGIYNAGILNMYGGSITNNIGNGGGGVDNFGTFNLYAGTIYKNEDKSISTGGGGGVANRGAVSVFNMYGGTISDNTSSRNGGGVYNAQTFNMYAGTISGNSSVYEGGGVYNFGNFHMRGGTIINNKTTNLYGNEGAGIYTKNGTLSLSGSPQITDNQKDNLYQSSGNLVITGALTTDANISLSNGSLGTVAVTSENSYVITKEDAKKFTSPSTDFKVVLDALNNRLAFGHDITDQVTMTIDSNTFTYTGDVLKPVVTVNKEHTILTEGTDYSILWPEDTTNVGEKTLTVYSIFTSDNPYVGSWTDTYNINQKNITPTIESLNNSYPYENGQQIKPEIVVKDETTVLTQGIDYDIEYGENKTVNSGGSITIKLKGNYTGSDITKTFAITKITPAYTVPTNLSATYGETLNEVILPNVSNGTWTWLEPAAHVGNAGTQVHKAKFTPNDTENYNIVTADIPIKVAKADLQLVAAPSASDIEYGQTLAESLLTNGNVSSKVTGETIPGIWNWADSTKQPATAGTHTTDVVFTADISKNYNDFYLQGVAVNVIKTKPDIEISLSSEKQVAGKDIVVTVTIKNPYDDTLDILPSLASLSYRIGENGKKVQLPTDTETCTFSIPKDTKAGTNIMISASTGADDNYEENTATASLTIVKKSADTSSDNTPDTGDSSNIEKPAGTVSDNAPDTSDSSSIILWIALMILSLGCIKRKSA